jgi:hypothetical protein
LPAAPAELIISSISSPAPIESWWQDLGRPRLTTAVVEKIVSGVYAESAGRSVEELAEERDRLLVEILALKRGARKP